MLTVSFCYDNCIRKERIRNLVRCCPDCFVCEVWYHLKSRSNELATVDFHRFTVLYCQKLFCLRYRSFFAKIYDLSNYLEK